jgi:hypothetical protein
MQPGQVERLHRVSLDLIYLCDKSGPNQQVQRQPVHRQTLLHSVEWSVDVCAVMGAQVKASRIAPITVSNPREWFNLDA